MLWILLFFGAIGTIFMLCMLMSAIWREDLYDVKDASIKMAIFLVVGLIGVFGIKWIYHQGDCEVSEINSFELISIVDNSQVSGELYYIQATTNPKEVYSFYYKVEQSGFKLGTIEANVTTIYEKEDCSPKVVEYTNHRKNKINKALRIFLVFSGSYGESSQKTYEVFIPEGTILKSFNLDSQ